MTKPILIEDIDVIVTQPGISQLVIVKVHTSEPGLYGLGCATFKQRYHSVVAAIEKHLKPFAVGRDVSRIEEIFQMAMVNGYWRNGPVLNNAVSGIDQALWDIKGKLAGMPVYQLLGGKVREGADVYVHADDASADQVVDNIRAYQEQGHRHFRIQLGKYGGVPTEMMKPEGAPPGAYYDPKAYMRSTLGLFDHVRSELGGDIELLHDVHERLATIDAVRFAKDLEQYRLFFLEDILPPEQSAWLSTMREQCATPIALGELFNNPHEWQPLIAERLIDFVRIHISQIGGLTPARKVAALAEAFGVRTAWHGPSDTSPVGHAANVHLDVSTMAFGIQEFYKAKPLDFEMFPGMPEIRNGYIYPNDQPGLGIDIDLDLAAKYPPKDEVIDWTQARLPDGSPARP